MLARKQDDLDFSGVVSRLPVPSTPSGFVILRGMAMVFPSSPDLVVILLRESAD